MAIAKEIRYKVKTIKSTQKITRAMQMVAASKMRKAQERMESSRPYTQKIREVISHLITSRLEYKHSYLIKREPKKVGFIVISSDRGLCGGLNVNLFKATVQKMKSLHEKGSEIQLCTVGSKGESFFKNLGGNIIATVSKLGDSPGLEDLIGIMKVMFDGYDKGTLDCIYLVSNKFINTMTQQPQVEKILPITSDESIQKVNVNTNKNWDYLYEPDAKTLLDELITRYIESLIYQGLVENIACEQAARMVAMKSASDNASNLIDELNLKYNKARQAAITQELSEIVAGAAAV